MISFGQGYEYDPEKSSEENFKSMQKYYAKKGIIVNDLTPEEKKELIEFANKIIPELKELRKFI
jgi:tryptophan synthase alpha subunit